MPLPRTFTSEFFETSESFHLSALQHLNANDAAGLDDQSLESIKAIREYSSVGSTVLEPDYAAVVGDLRFFFSKILTARSQMNGLEEEGDAIASSEFLITFLDDQLKRIPRLIGDVAKRAGKEGCRRFCIRPLALACLPRRAESSTPSRTWTISKTIMASQRI